jgi:phenylalanyl-tRNA synthetase alpha chain
MFKMLNRIQSIFEEIKNFESTHSEQIEQFRINLVGKKGKITQLFDEFRIVAPEIKKEVGKKLNELKVLANEKLNELKSKAEIPTSNKDSIDLSRPGEPFPIGSRHPISIVKNEIIEIFNRIGFAVAEGPEIEDDWHNFSALNFPAEHPARDMQDTFFLGKNPDYLLRTHTTSVQIRELERRKPPIRIIMPGRVFRNEAISARAHCIFHQVDGVYIDRNVSFGDLKQTLLYFAQEMFGENSQIRLRPSFFPFTEPSAEMDVSCNLCQGKGCNVCKYTGWLEILGCGMIDPNVLISASIDTDEFTGFAWGMGVERIAMLKYGIRDLRLFFENDLRFLKQFTSAF